PQILSKGLASAMVRSPVSSSFCSSSGFWPNLATLPLVTICSHLCARATNKPRYSVSRAMRARSDLGPHCRIKAFDLVTQKTMCVNTRWAYCSAERLLFLWRRLLQDLGKRGLVFEQSRLFRPVQGPRQTKASYVSNRKTLVAILTS